MLVNSGGGQNFVNYIDYAVDYVGGFQLNNFDSQIELIRKINIVLDFNNNNQFFMMNLRLQNFHGQKNNMCNTAVFWKAKMLSEYR